MFQTGQIILLKHFPSNTVISNIILKVEERQHSSSNQQQNLPKQYGFRVAASGGCLRILPNGQTDLLGGEGAWATFEPLQNPQDASHFLLSSIGHKQQNAPRFLSFVASSLSSSSSSSYPGAQAAPPATFASSTDINSPACRWTFVVVTDQSTVEKTFQQMTQLRQIQSQQWMKSMTNPILLRPLADVMSEEKAKNGASTVPEQQQKASLPDEYVIQYEDGDCVRLVSPSTGLCIPFPFTFEFTSQQHLDALIEIMYEKFNVVRGTRILSLQDKSNSPETAFPAGSVVHLFAHDDKSTSTSNINSNADASHLRMLGNSFDTNGGLGPPATWEVTKTRSGLLFRCIHFASSNPSEHRYLSINAQSKTLSFTNSPSSDETAYWMLQKAQAPLTSRQSYLLTPKFMEDVDFSPQQREFFKQNGYVVVKNVIQDASLIEGALRFLNHLLGQGPKAWKLDEEKNKHVLENSSHHSIVALFRASRIPTLLQRLLGRSNVELVKSVQLALRFPVVNEFDEDAGLGVAADAKNNSVDNWHIDGQENNSGNCLPFSLLVKVALSDQTKEGCGNFTVFPGSHKRRDVVEWYHSVTRKRENATSNSNQLANIIASRPSLAGIEPLQVLLAPGDAVFAHPYLCHRVGFNVSPNIRYSTIVRIHAKNLMQVRNQPEKIIQDPVNWYFSDSK